MYFFALATCSIYCLCPLIDRLLFCCNTVPNQTLHYVVSSASIFRNSSTEEGGIVPLSPSYFHMHKVKWDEEFGCMIHYLFTSVS